MLIEQEKKIEEILELLHECGMNDYPPQAYRDATNKVEEVIKIWSKFLSNDDAFDVLENILLLLKSEQDISHLRCAAHILDLLITPFEHYTVSLEEFKHPSFRDAATRCGMVIERMLKRLWPIIGDTKTIPKKVEDQVGILQEYATKTLHFEDAEDICHLMKSIYHTRDRKGPHDVPAAEEMDAKFCISSLPRVYSFYLQIIENIYPDTSIYTPALRELANSILIIRPAIVTGKKGEKPVAESAIILLYKNGFFKQDVTFSSIMEKLKELEFSFPKATVMNTLNRLHKKGILNRTGNKRNYKFMQRISPEEYFR